MILTRYTIVQTRVIRLPSRRCFCWKILLHTSFNRKRFRKISLQAQTRRNKKCWKTKGKITELLNPSGNAITDDKGKAEILNAHFASVFTKEKMDDIPQLDLEKDDINIIDSVTVSTEKLIKLLNKLNISKSAGPDGINSRILKETSSQIAPGLKILLTSLFQKEKNPSQWSY